MNINGLKACLFWSCMIRLEVSRGIVSFSPTGMYCTVQTLANRPWTNHNYFQITQPGSSGVLGSAKTGLKLVHFRPARPPGRHIKGQSALLLLLRVREVFTTVSEPPTHTPGNHTQPQCYLSGHFPVIRFVWVSAKFGTCTVVSVNVTHVEDKMRRFKGEC